MWRATGQVSYARALGERGASFSAARAWSPLLAPAVCELVLIVLSVLLARHPMGHVVIPWDHVWLLAALLLAVGVGFGVALKAAATDTAWMSLLAGGVYVYLTLTTLVLFGLQAGGVVALLLAVAAGVLVGDRFQRVAADTVQVTTLFGTHCRTLLPGLSMLVPGEAVQATLPTSPREHATLPQRASNGAQACAKMRYQLIPQEAQRVAPAGGDWQRDFHRLLVTTLRQELARWADGEREWEAAPDGTELDVTWLRQQIERSMQAQALARGMRVAWVQLEGVVSPPSEPPSAPELRPAPTSERERPRVVEGSLVPTVTPGATPQGAAAPALPPPPSEDDAVDAVLPVALGATPTGRDAAAAATPRRPPIWLSRSRQTFSAVSSAVGRLAQAGRTASQRSGGAPSPDEPSTESHGEGSGGDEAPSGDAASAPIGPQLPSPRVLAAAYEAVREGRIADPATVLHIADTFARLASTGDLPANVDMNPDAAARNLRQLAETLGASSPPPQEDAPPPRPSGIARHADPPQDARDENLLRGG